MPYDFSGAFKQFDEERDRARQSRLDKQKAEETKYAHRKDVDFAGSTDPGEKAFADRMAEKSAADSDYKRANAEYLRQKYPGGPSAGHGETGIPAKIKALAEISGEFDETRKERQPWYDLGTPNKEYLTEEELAAEQQAKSARNRILGLGDRMAKPAAQQPAGAPAPRASASSAPLWKKYAR